MQDPGSWILDAGRRSSPQAGESINAYEYFDKEGV